MNKRSYLFSFRGTGGKVAAVLLVKNGSDAANPMLIGVRADWAVAWQSGGGVGVSGGVRAGTSGFAAGLETMNGRAGPGSGELFRRQGSHLGVVGADPVGRGRNAGPRTVGTVFGDAQARQTQG